MASYKKVHVLPDSAKYRLLEEKYPHLKSTWTRLLEEVARGEDLKFRDWCAWEFGLSRYKRGLGKISRTLFAVLREAQSATLDSAHNYRGLIHSIVVALGRIDTENSHELLVQLVRQQEDVALVGDALTAMAFERTRADISLITEFIDADRDPWVLCSALYAAEFQFAINSHPELLGRLEAMLEHHDPLVRCAAIGALRFSPLATNPVKRMLDDEVDFVQEAARSCLFEISQLGVHEI